ncbi:hypothetical protein [Erwinia sp. JUb26]|uniref:hypothetical protein n=1 Tax=Erwinia sp. JUb26 TaxID=2485126 RepID=UPI000FA4D838|nr:hypothetical protein [Erwinia sp. JUb26]ROR11486.1 thymidylate kinase [Erwinia sp. JUb26]
MRELKKDIIHSPVRVIAITGCDGAGKSTLATHLVNRLSAQGSVELVYLGQSSGFIGKWIGNLPIMGSYIGNYLFSRSERVHSRPSSPPGNIAALVIYLLSCWRAVKFHRMLRKSEQGCLLITDRYPQAEAPGFRVDGPQLAKAEGGNYWIRMLRKSEQRLYLWMASYPPALLIRLNIDEQTAHLRKPDHALSALREKIEAIPQLTFNGAKILDLDAREAESIIIGRSLQAIHSTLSGLQKNA